MQTNNNTVNKCDNPSPKYGFIMVFCSHLTSGMNINMIFHLTVKLA